MDSGGAALLRRHSSRQGLQNLLRLTAQWSLEDEEEAARERRRRERERQLRAQSEDHTEQEKLLALKPPELEEDEGFGDWSHRPEARKPSRGEAGDSPDCEDRTEGSSHRSEEEEEETEAEEEPGLRPRRVGAAPGPDSPEEEDSGALRTTARVEAPSPAGPPARDEEDQPPLGPSPKLADRTEALTRSVERSNSVRKAQPGLPVAKIDDRLEQYTQAVGTAGKPPKLARQPSVEMPSMTVADSRSLWETGELLAQASPRTPPCKDIVAGDMSKRSFWEHRGGGKTSSTVKSTPSGKRYKFVATGHGKYEKVLLDDGAAP